MKLLIFWLASICGICYACPKSVPVYKLLDGNEMPAVGLGTFLLETSNSAETAVLSALDNGYRLIDTAYLYHNEQYIGNALKKWFAKGNKREDVFITTKLPFQAMRSCDVEKALKLSLKNFGLDYVDMYLVHFPFATERTADFNPLKDQNGEYVLDYSTNLHDIWRALEEQVRAGRVKSLGMSNFNMTQLLRVWDFAKIKPSNLEMETNAYIQENELRKFCREKGIVFTAYSPLGSGGISHLRRKREADNNLPPLLENPVIAEIAKAHNKTPAQVSLRFDLQLGCVVIPKSKHPNRIQENIDIFDFHLSEEEMKKMKSLDQHGKYRKYDFLTLKHVERHPEYPYTDRIPQH